MREAMIRWTGVAFMAMALSACGGDDAVDVTAAPPASTPPIAAPPSSVTAVIGAEGGTVNGPDGVQVIIPAGALTQPTTIGIARGSIGAPALPTDNPPVGSAYEFTPHDLVFNAPVTLRMPVLAGAVGNELFMASPGEDWQVVETVVTAGVAEWQRNTFSWSMLGAACFVSSSNTDPYPCVYPSGAANAIGVPDQTITRRTFGSGNGNAGSWVINQPGIVKVVANYRAAPDCGFNGAGSAGKLKVVRWNPAVYPRVIQTVFDGIVPLTPTPMPLSGGFASSSGAVLRGVGSTTVDVSAYLTDAVNAVGVSFGCARPGKSFLYGGDTLTFIGSMPNPGPFAISGEVITLTGAGLVLQNNGTDSLAVPPFARSFAFPTPVPKGTPYSVTVASQPAGQTCVVERGSGTMTANVASVAIVCSNVASVGWSAALAISPPGVLAGDPAVAAASDGRATLAWAQYDADNLQYNGYASAFDGVAGAWQAPQLIEALDANTVASTGGGVFTPRIAMAANQRAHIVFGFTVQPGSFQAAMSRWADNRWTAQTITSGGNATDRALSFAADGSTAVMMYPQFDGTRYSIQSQVYNYTNATLTALSPEGGMSLGGAENPSLATLGSNEVVGVWTTSARDVWSNRFSAATQSWAVPVQLNPGSSGNAYPVEVSANAAGMAAAIWLDLNSGYKAYASRLSGGTWSAPVALATEADGSIRNFNTSRSSGASGLDASGNGYFAWVQADPTNNSVQHVRLRRCPTAQAMSACEAVETLDTRPERAGEPAVVVGPTGDVWVAWVSTSLIGEGEIRVRRRDAGGWSAVVTLGASWSTTVRPAIAVDGLNHVTIAWLGADRRIQVARGQ